MKDLITIEDFSKVDVRMGTVLTCEKVEGSEKLIKLLVDFGEEVGQKQILTGLGKFFETSHFVGKQMPFIINLEARKMMGLESQGMIMAAEGEKPVLLIPEETLENGASVI